jgi:hypothetical protein
MAQIFRTASVTEFGGQEVDVLLFKHEVRHVHAKQKPQ